MAVRIKSKGCCDCAANACGMECRSQSAFAGFCGFPEFVPSSPPRYYRTKRIEGKALVCIFDGGECNPTCEESGPSAWSGGGLKTVYSGSPRYQFSGSVYPLSYDTATDRWTYLGTVGAARWEEVLPDGSVVWHPAASRPSLVGGVSSVQTGPSTWLIEVDPCHAGNAGVEVYAGGWYVIESGPIVTPAPENSIAGARDTLDATVTYSVSGGVCAPHEDAGDSERLSLAASTCVRDAPGDVVTLPSIHPAELYGNHLLAVDSATQREWISVGCTPDESGQSWDVTPIDGLTETLSDEDTVDTALARATEGLGWTGGECHLHTSWATMPSGEDNSFGFRRAQVRAVCGSSTAPLTIGHTYEATLYLQERVLGSGGPYFPAGTAVVQFTADETIERSDWIEIPVVVGMETRAAGCGLVDVTA